MDLAVVMLQIFKRPVWFF